MLENTKNYQISTLVAALRRSFLQKTVFFNMCEKIAVSSFLKPEQKPEVFKDNFFFPLFRSKIDFIVGTLFSLSCFNFFSFFLTCNQSVSHKNRRNEDRMIKTRVNLDSGNLSMKSFE